MRAYKRRAGIVARASFRSDRDTHARHGSGGDLAPHARQRSHHAELGRCESRRGVAGLRWGSPAGEHKMLAVHGRLDNAASFNFVGPIFAAAGYELVAIDLPGHGHSPWKPDGIYSLLSQAASIAQALDALGWSSCTMLAHSLGCSYATVVVGALPGRFAACVFIEGFSGFGLSFAVDFGVKSEDVDQRRVTAEPHRLRMSLTNGTQLHSCGTAAV